MRRAAREDLRVDEKRADENRVDENRADDVDVEFLGSLARACANLVETDFGRWRKLAGGAFAVEALGITAFPFGVVQRVLTGEPFKRLASFGGVLPAVAERSAAAHLGRGGGPADG